MSRGVEKKMAGKKKGKMRTEFSKKELIRRHRVDGFEKNLCSQFISSVCRPLVAGPFVTANGSIS
jgi:hypothetical protein